ncbi:hypothetical protein BH11ARM2_BH11ARM2_19480 [soil metagenome]
MPELFTGPFFPAASLPSRSGDDLWLIPGIVPRDGLVVLASAPKTGKTCLASAIARSIACGTPFLGHTPPQGPVLWCAHEEIPDERGRLHEGLSNDDPLLIAYPGYLPTLDEPDRSVRDRFGRYRDVEPPSYVFSNAVEVDAKLIVIDCLHAAVERGNLADNATARRVMGRLRRLSWMNHIPVLVLHHLTKSTSRGSSPERFADSAQILAAASCHFYMERKEETVGGSSRSSVSGTVSVPSAPEETASRITLYGEGRHPTPPRKLELLSTGPLHYELAEEASVKPQPRPTAVSRVANLLSEGWELTSEEIARRLEINPVTVRDALNRLAGEGRAEKLASPQKRLRYRSFTPKTEG